MVTRDYELGFILNPEVSEEQTRAILNRVEQIVATHGGQVVRVNQWGRRRLSYPIEHHRDGNYIFLDMILTPETVAELDRTLRVSEDVLRHLMKRRDSRTVQKEREARAAAAANAEARAQEQAQAQEQDQAEATTANIEAIEAIEAAVEEALAEAEQEVASVGEESAEPAVLTEEDMAAVPAAVDDETVE